MADHKFVSEDNLDATMTTIDSDDGSAFRAQQDARLDTAVQAALTGGALPGTTLTVYYSNSTGWPDRPTERTDIVVVWTGADENNPPPGAAVGVDKWDRPVS